MKNVVDAGVMGRKLINYLPYQVREFKEYQGITTGEQPEFELAWNHWQEVFDNQYIDTAGDYGLSRWEKMLGINPKATDSLETRRIRIKTRLNNFTPYTFRAFMRMLKSLADGEPFEVYLDPGTYLMRFILQWGVNGKIDSLKWLIDEILPENIAIESKNEIPCVSEGWAWVAGGACFVNTFFLTNDGVEDHTISGVRVIGGGTVGVEKFFITNDGVERHKVSGPSLIGGGMAGVEQYLITHDGREQIEATGAVSARGGIAHTVCPPLVTNDSVDFIKLKGTTVPVGGSANSVLVMLTNDFSERFTISGTDKVGGGTVATEIIKTNSEEERTDP